MASRSTLVGLGNAYYGHTYRKEILRNIWELSKLQLGVGMIFLDVELLKLCP